MLSWSPVAGASDVDRLVDGVDELYVMRSPRADRADAEVRRLRARLEQLGEGR